MRAVPGAALVAAMCGWMAASLATGWLGEDVSPSGRVMLASAFAVFALALGGAAITYFLALFARAPVVCVDSHGIHDSRLTREPIAWTDITGGFPVLNGGQLMLTLQLVAPARYRLSRNPLWAVNRLSSRLLGRPEIAIRMTGLDGDLEALFKAIEEANRPLTAIPSA